MCLKRNAPATTAPNLFFYNTVENQLILITFVKTSRCNLTRENINVPTSPTNFCCTTLRSAKQ